MIEKQKGKVALHHYPAARLNETPEQKAIRRAGQTDLQNDMEDQQVASADAVGIEAPPAPKPVTTKTQTGEITVNTQAPGYRTATITRESDRPGDIKTTEQRKKTVG
jgi:hypothetical protein